MRESDCRENWGIGDKNTYNFDYSSKVAEAAVKVVMMVAIRIVVVRWRWSDFGNQHWGVLVVEVVIRVVAVKVE
ncbi:hypothetical protein C2S52_016162 [Perilla frutescens var. hirtella]|nr:hypothetical protein C2S52_016162 [Perilla frutescens var. hirtella]